MQSLWAKMTASAAQTSNAILTSGSTPKGFWGHLMDELFSVATLTTVASALIQIIVFYILARIAIRVFSRTIHRLLQSPAVKMDERRRNTLTSLSGNAIRYTIYCIFALMAMKVFGFHIETLLAGAGIAGVAIGFGAQSLIKDILTGFFILFEDQYAVGDVVKINNFTGTVITIGIRLTRIQASTGEIEIIPNGQITNVTNYSKTHSLAIIDVRVGYGTNLNDVLSVMRDVMERLKKENQNIVGDVAVLGVQELRESGVILRATAECLPMTHASVQRMAQQRIKEAFDERGIEIPYVQPTLRTGP